MPKTNKTGRIEKVEGMTYRPNAQTENNVQENNFAPRSRIRTLNFGKSVSTGEQSFDWASGFGYFIKQIGRQIKLSQEHIFIFLNCTIPYA